MTEIHWLAGLLEGDGCFTFSTSRFHYYPRIGASMGDRDVIVHVSGILGGRVYRMGRCGTSFSTKDMFQTFAQGREAAGWMMTLYPLMGERRREQIRQVLAMWLAPLTDEVRRSPAYIAAIEKSAAYMKEYGRKRWAEKKLRSSA